MQYRRCKDVCMVDQSDSISAEAAHLPSILLYNVDMRDLQFWPVTFPCAGSDCFECTDLVGESFLTDGRLVSCFSSGALTADAEPKSRCLFGSTLCAFSAANHTQTYLVLMSVSSMCGPLSRQSSLCLQQNTLEFVSVRAPGQHFANRPILGMSLLTKQAFSHISF